MKTNVGVSRFRQPGSQPGRRQKADGRWRGQTDLGFARDTLMLAVIRTA